MTGEEGPQYHYRDLYYSSRWQVIASLGVAEDGGFRFTAKETFVWTPGYVDELVERDSVYIEELDIDSDPESEEWETQGYSSDRIYVHQDANYNVTSIGNTSGTVLRRFIYDPYGSSSDLTAAWATTTTSTQWLYRHQGGRYNFVNETYHFRNRDYSAELGRWMQQDPNPDGQYLDGMSLYQAVVSSPVSWVDPSGLSRHKNWTPGKGIRSYDTPDGPILAGGGRPGHDGHFESYPDGTYWVPNPHDPNPPRYTPGPPPWGGPSQTEKELRELAKILQATAFAGAAGWNPYVGALAY